MKNKNVINRRTANRLLAMGSSSMLVSGFSSGKLDKKMTTRLIPSTNETIPIIGLGTWQTFDVGTAPSQREPLKEVLQILVDHGGSVVDSSPMYGRSQRVVGDLTTELNIKSKIWEATKVWTSGENNGIRQMNESMSLMKANPMDLMQIHNLLDWKTHIKTLRKWKEEGKIRYLGITHYHSGAYDEVERVMKTEPLDFVQINYSLAERESARRILPLAKDKGIAVIANRPYAGGSLFRKTKNQSLPEWAQEFDAHSWGQLFLKFVLSHPAMTCAIPGTARAEHMKDNVQAGFGKIPTETHQRKMIDLIS